LDWLIQNTIQSEVCNISQHLTQNLQHLTLNLDKINKSILPWFDNNRSIINKDKSLALGFHQKLNKHTVFPDIILKDRPITYVSETKFLAVC
jgi:hypothetical protein